MKRAIETLVLVGLVFLVAIGALAGWRVLGLLDEAQKTVVVFQDTLRIGRAALAEQRMYTKALSKMAVLDTNRLGKAIGSVDVAV